LFTVYPTLAPALLLGTNKIASLAGTAGAAVQYARTTRPRGTTIAPVVAAAFVASALGALALSHVPSEPLRKALPFVLLVLWVYTAWSDAGLAHEPRFARHHEAMVAASGAGAVGFYDGFFGPGAGAFYKLIFVRTLGFDFRNAAAPAKFANVASNLAAIGVFVANGMVIWQLAIVMAVANFLGGQVGSRIALRYGNRFMRWAFLAVVALLIVKTFHDAYA